MKRTGIRRPSYAEFLATGKKPTGIARRTPVRRQKPQRAAEDQQYLRLRKQYLIDHPWCMIWIAMHGLDEAEVIRANGWCWIFGARCRAHRSNQVHHRNKARDGRKCDTRWWMAAAHKGHDLVEGNKGWARANGYLLPFEADSDGKLPNGEQCLETSAFMRSMRLKAESVSAS